MFYKLATFLLPMHADDIRLLLNPFYKTCDLLSLIKKNTVLTTTKCDVCMLTTILIKITSLTSPHLLIFRGVGDLEKFHDWLHD